MITTPPLSMSSHPVVSREKWLVERRKLLAREKELTRLRDALNQERLQMPWVRVEKDYRFEGEQGTRSLGDLFGGRSQLFVYHFMFGPGWKEGCVGCSFLVDHLNGILDHLTNHDVAVAVISRAPLAELLAFKKRMGWRFDWFSSHGSDFNFDFEVSYTPEQMASGRTPYNFGEVDALVEEQHGSSAFYRDADGAIYHTYSTFARGDEAQIGAYAILDMMPKGRNEAGPGGNLTDWVRHHDRYGTGETGDCCGCSST